MEPAFGSPPSAFFYDEDFEGVHGIPASWQVALGTWQADGQTYNSTTPTSAALTTIFEYPPIDQPGDITDQFDFDDFTLTARLRNQGGSASTLVGLVYLSIATRRTTSRWRSHPPVLRICGAWVAARWKPWLRRPIQAAVRVCGSASSCIEPPIRPA